MDPRVGVGRAGDHFDAVIVGFLGFGFWAYRVDRVYRVYILEGLEVLGF